MKKKLALLMSLLMVLGIVFSGCNSPAETDAQNPEDRVLKVRKKNAMMSTDWEQTTESEDMQITFVQVFEGLYGINEAQGGYVNLLAKDGSAALYGNFAGCHLPKRRCAESLRRSLQLPQGHGKSPL